MNYVVGFLFSEDRGIVCLIRKNKPEWQAGKLNGIGGKIDKYELPIGAMRREFYEETGVIFEDWKELAVLSGPDFTVHFFYAFSDLVFECKTQEEEAVGLYSAAGVNVLPVLSNLKFLIPMALDQSGLKKPVALFDEQYDDDAKRLSCFSSGKLCPQCDQPYSSMTSEGLEEGGRDLFLVKYQHANYQCDSRHYF